MSSRKHERRRQDYSPDTKHRSREENDRSVKRARHKRSPCSSDAPSESPPRPSRSESDEDPLPKRRRDKVLREPNSPERKHHKSSKRSRHRESDEEPVDDRRSKDRHKHSNSRSESRRSPERREKHKHRKRDSSRDRGHSDKGHRWISPKRERRSRSPTRGRVRVKREPTSPPAQNHDDRSNAAAQKQHGPDFKLSGNLAADTNTYKGVVIKYNQPPEARKPREKWRLYPFKGEESLPVVPLHRSSGYLIGRDRIVADIPIDHPSCSKQHAVLQFRLVDITRADGTMGRKIKPYTIDLGSTNGTYLNGKRIEAQRYHELREKDVLKFGFSSREYVLLHEKSQTDQDDSEEES